MGTSAAVCFKRAGYRVLLWARNARKLAATDETLNTLEHWLESHVAPPLRRGGTIERIENLNDIDAQADLIMDCIAEDMAKKVELFHGMTGAIHRGAVFITTTSGLNISQLGTESGTGPLLAGTHFWNPPHLMPLVEVIRGDQTPASLIDRICELIESIGKIPVRVNRDVPGFIGNRLLHALWREALNLVERNIATPEDIDRVARLTFGLRMAAIGPVENMDMVGLDLIETIHQYLLADLADQHQPLRVHREQIDRGNLGMKSGKGFYDWSQRDPDELIERRDRQIVHQLKFLKELDAL